MTRVVFRVLAAIALGISAYVHLHLAHLYSYPGTITGTELFRAQGIVAAVVAVALLLTGNRWVWLAAVAIGLASFAAVMLYRYVDVGAIGPLPNMNDATWQPSPEKLLSAVAEASVVLWWLLDQAVARSIRKRPTPRPAGARQPVGS
jgi:hypothetical protein